MKARVILNICPPAICHIPTAGVTAIKSYLSKNDYDADIIYWNLDFEILQKNFLFNKRSLDDYGLAHSELLFLSYIAITENDTTLYNSIKKFLYGLDPGRSHYDSNYFDRHMQTFQIKLDEIISYNLEKYAMSDALCFGFPIKLDQWLVSSIIGAKLKKLYPNKLIIVGGINTSEAAASILQNFPQFDIGVWGEGEIKMLEICKQLVKQNPDLSKISNIIYRDNGNLYKSVSKHQKYIDLSETNYYFDFSDYFNHPNINGKEHENITLPIENSRGCHWGKCHFCYLNVGYKYRIKSIEKIKKEIIYYIMQYNTFSFAFLDNDIVGKDLGRFNELLDCFIEIKAKYPKFRIVSAEIITKGLTEDVIKKMADAGIFMVQIGWESSSNELLSKIDKKNTFASNLQFVKFAFKYNIRLSPLNIILNLLEETDDDINEAIANIKFLRFFRSDPNLTQRLCKLTINATSKYFIKSQINNVDGYEPYNILHHFMKSYVNDKCAWNLFDFLSPNKNKLWNIFEQVELYYKKNKHSYRVHINDDIMTISEFVGYKLIKQIELLISSLDYYIMLFTQTIINLEMLKTKIEKHTSVILAEEKLREYLDKYSETGMIYHSKDYNEILSIIEIPLI